MSASVRGDLVRRVAVAAIELDEPIPLDAVPTPALLLDEAALDRNLVRMADHLSSKRKLARPHAKTHKCPIIARRQIEAGAVGICAAKTSEAMVMRGAGIDEVLITSPIVDTARAELIADMVAEGPGLMVVIDSVLGVECLERALADRGASMTVLIDLDPRMGRTGVRELEDARRLAARISASSVLNLAGVQHYCGHVMHVQGHGERSAQSTAHWQRAFTVIDALRADGHAIDVVSGGGTGTYDIDCEFDPITDLQVGSYALMDEQYRVIGSKTSAVLDEFEVALTVVTTAISQPAAGAITVDCGFKGFASESIAPVAPEYAGATYRFAGDEHGVLVLANGAQSPLIGDRVEFITPHCDPTVNLYDHYFVHRDGRVHALWPIAARGCSW